jgi:hypothetical protein
VEVVETAEHPRRFVAEAARAGRAVVLFRQPDVARAVEDAFEADPGLGSRQRAARAGVRAASERDVLAGVGAVEAELGWALEAAGVPGAMSTPPIVVARRARRKSAFTGLSMRRASSMKLGMSSGFARSSSWSSGYSARYFSDVASRRAVVSCPAANRKLAERTTAVTSGVDPSGYFASARSVSTSPRGSWRRSSMYVVK